MKNTGRIASFVLAVMCYAPLYAADIRVSLSDGTIAAGESTEFTITVTGTSNVQVPDIPRVDGLQIIYGGQGSSFQFFNGRTSSSVTITFHVLGEKEGRYTIPSFDVATGEGPLRTREVSLTVSGGSSASAVHGGGSVLCDVEFSQNTVYSGQPVIMRYFIYHGEGSRIEVQRIVEPPVTKGFIIKEINEKMQPVTVAKNGRSYVRVHLQSWCLIPELSGEHETGGGTVLAGINQGADFFSMPVSTELRFPLKKIRVRPVPDKGKPAGYSGDTGEFVIDAKPVGGTFRVNEEIKVPVTVSGKGNFLLMSKPVFENAEGLRIIFEESEPELSLTGNVITGTKKYVVTLIPQREGSIRAGRVVLKYFNPDTVSYGIASSGPFTFEVSGILTPQEQVRQQEQVEGKGLPVIAYAVAGALVMAAVLAAAYIIIRERRRYAEMKVDDAEKSPALKVEVREDTVMLLRDELEEAHGSGDYDRLMRLCVRAVDVINGRGLSSVEFESVKGKLDAARYANAELSVHEMEDVYKTVLKLLL